MSMFTKILCPVDFSEASAPVAKVAREFALAFNAEIVALYVAPSMIQYEIFDLPAVSLPQLVGDITVGAEKTMVEFVAKHFPDVCATGKVVSGDAADSIVTLAQVEKADIIIMATHGRQGLNRLLFGSVAEKVVKTSPVPVMTIRPEA
ncbi:universal stress protein [Desulfomicrobium orale]|uniref:Universal stress protein n=1 Tax=Desulfomicrobium orale DSM 12838 TaxID=888061 RepID=A0A0X8JNU9_9BACT|nr:universal stress protein [Desulfomicrobium orale]AMD92152.1 universal stress protein [Desulfomicrobium orale DSM 12838]